MLELLANMLRCVLGDGSIFEYDRKALCSECGFIEAMLDDREEDVVPLPMIPSCDRMSAVVHYSPHDSIEGLIQLAVDSDYLNYRSTFEETVKSLMKLIEEGTDEDVEKIVDTLPDSVLGYVLSKVDCGVFMETHMVGVYTFPLPRHIQIVVERCGRYVSHVRDSVLFKKLQIARYFINVKTDDQYVTMIQRILRGERRDVGGSATAYVAAALGDIDLLKLHSPSAVLSDCFHVAASMGDIDVFRACVELARANERGWPWDISHRIQDTIDIALQRGFTVFCDRVVELIDEGVLPVDKKIVTYLAHAETIHYLLDRGFVFNPNAKCWYGDLFCVALRQSDIKVVEMLLAMDHFYKRLTTGPVYWYHFATYIPLCSDREIMKILVQLLKKHPHSMNHDINAFRRPRTKNVHLDCIFGQLRREIIETSDVGWKLYDEVVASMSD